jgi:formylglycine-generating enzyme required for sulfatase activity
MKSRKILTVLAAIAFAALAVVMTGCPTDGGGTDTTAPVLSAGSVSAYETTAGTTATVNFTSNEAGTYYVVVYASATDAPASGAALKTAYDGGVTGTTIAIASAAATASANTANITGLTTNTAYKAHVTVKDAAGNYSTVWSSAAFTPITAVESAAFTSAVGDNTLTITLTGGTYAASPTLSQFSISTQGTSGFTNLTGGRVTRTNDMVVTITGLMAVTSTGSGQKITVAAAAQATQAASVTVAASYNTFTTPALYRSMASIEAITNLAGAGSSGVFIANRTVTLSAFKIAKYETTYELWYEVKTWATSNGYTFTNQGQEGNDGTTGAEPTSAKTEPVTNVSWRDAVVWCNAYSEMSGKTPAYYSNSNYSTVIKSLSGDTVYMKSDATGYRLPTEAEWEAAARGGNPSDTTNWAYTYAGADTLPADTTAVAWYNSNSGSGTHPVGTGLTGGLNGDGSNSAGLYDMSGNVHEWCWDCYNSGISTGSVSNPAGASSGPYRVFRGGCWYSYADGCSVSSRYGSTPDYRGSTYSTLKNLGFRVVCAP